MLQVQQLPELAVLVEELPAAPVTTLLPQPQHQIQVQVVVVAHGHTVVLVAGLAGLVLLL
jgi:hypothetical protein